MKRKQVKNTILKAITTAAVLALFMSTGMDSVKGMLITITLSSGWLFAFGKANGLF